MTITENHKEQRAIQRALGELKNIKSRWPVSKSIVAFRTKQLLERLGELRMV